MENEPIFSNEVVAPIEKKAVTTEKSSSSSKNGRQSGSSSKQSPLAQSVFSPLSARSSASSKSSSRSSPKFFDVRSPVGDYIRGISQKVERPGRHMAAHISIGASDKDNEPFLTYSTPKVVIRSVPSATLMHQNELMRKNSGRSSASAESSESRIVQDDFEDLVVVGVSYTKLHDELRRMKVAITEHVANDFVSDVLSQDWSKLLKQHREPELLGLKFVEDLEPHVFAELSPEPSNDEVAVRLNSSRTGVVKFHFPEAASPDGPSKKLRRIHTPVPNKSEIMKLDELEDEDEDVFDEETEENDKILGEFEDDDQGSSSADEDEEKEEEFACKELMLAADDLDESKIRYKSHLRLQLRNKSFRWVVIYNNFLLIYKTQRSSAPDTVALLDSATIKGAENKTTGLATGFHVFTRVGRHLEFDAESESAANIWLNLLENSGFEKITSTAPPAAPLDELERCNFDYCAIL